MRIYPTSLHKTFASRFKQSTTVLRRTLLSATFCLGILNMAAVSAGDLTTHCAVKADGIQQQSFQMANPPMWMDLNHLAPQVWGQPIVDYYCRECRRIGCSNMWCLPCCPPTR